VLGQGLHSFPAFLSPFLWRSTFSKWSRGAWWQRCNVHLLARSFILEPKNYIKGKGSPLHQQSVREVFSARCLHLFASHRGGLDYLCWSKVHFLGQNFPLVGGVAGLAVHLLCFVFLTLLFSTVDHQEFLLLLTKERNQIHCNAWFGHQVKQRNPQWTSCL